MGLLDEAIREHLELKRRGGADPSEVARKEHEALAPVFPDEHEGTGADTQPPDGVGQEQVTEAYTLPWESTEQSDASGVDMPTVGQETAELDMQAVMAEADDPTSGAEPAGGAASGR